MDNRDPLLYANGAGSSRQAHRLIPGASKKALRSGLRDLELAQVIVRHDLTDTVLHVEYDFASDRRQAVCDLLDHLAQLGESIEAKERML